jgi:hypothetical protein
VLEGVYIYSQNQGRLEEGTSDGDSMTVALTNDDERARHEVLAWLIQRSIMTVQRNNGQCLGCAVKTAHCVGGLVVVV